MSCLREGSVYELSEGVCKSCLRECVRAVRGRGVCMSCLREGSVYELSEGGECV